MNLDRFGVGLMDAQQEMPVDNCEQCGHEIYEGESVVIYDGDCYCSEYCLLDAMKENGDYEERIAG